MSTQARILNSTFDAITLDQTVDEVVARVREGRRGWLCTVNVAVLMMMRQDPWLQDFVDRAEMVVADGQPLVWFAPLFGSRLPARVAGIDLIYALSHRSSRVGLTVGLLGAKPAVVDQARERLRELCPRLTVAYTGDGYFGPDEAPARAAAIREAGVDVLFVGMGVPRQERFIAEQWEQLGVKMAIGVGGSFEVMAGRVARAPVLLQRLGLEWAFRLIQEPRRLWRRYLVTNTQFLGLVARQLLRWPTRGRALLPAGLTRGRPRGADRAPAPSGSSLRE